MWNLPTGIQEPDPRGSKANECYTHDSLVTNASGDKGVSWRYYTPSVSNPGNPLGIIWDAPEGIPEVCYGQNEATGNPCSGSEFTSHVVYPEENQFGFDYNGAPILTTSRIVACRRLAGSFLTRPGLITPSAT